MSFLATTGGISGDDVRDLMVTAVEHRFGRVNRLPATIEWLSDNGSCYIAGDTRRFARDIVASAAVVDRTLQRGSSTQGSRISFTT
jgi:transposase InsO family protein